MAEDPDNTGMFSREFPPSDDNLRSFSTFNFTLLEDNLVEGDECFQVSVSPLDNEQIIPVRVRLLTVDIVDDESKFKFSNEQECFIILHIWLHIYTCA